MEIVGGNDIISVYESDEYIKSLIVKSGGGIDYSSPTEALAEDVKNRARTAVARVKSSYSMPPGEWTVQGMSDLMFHVFGVDVNMGDDVSTCVRIIELCRLRDV